MLLLARIIKAADEVVIFTNRRIPKEGRFTNSGNFPFFGQGVIDRMIKVFGDKIKFEKKEWGNDPTKLMEIAQRPMEGQPVGLTYAIGSADNDRVKIGGMRGIRNPEKLVYLDTGHYKI